MYSKNGNEFDLIQNQISFSYSTLIAWYLNCLDLNRNSSSSLFISRLTDPQTRQRPEQKEKADENFKKALEYLLQYIEKDKHFDALFEQITRRVIKSPDKRNLLELAFCLSQIKSITNKGARTFSKIASENKDEIQKALGVKCGLKRNV